MKRAAAVALAAALAVCAGPACSDPSFEVPRAQAQNTPQQPAPTAPAQGAPPPAAEDSARYSFHRVGEGFVRLDLRTGELVAVRLGRHRLVLQARARRACGAGGEIARLQRENAALKKALLSKGIELPPGAIAEAPSPARRRASSAGEGARCYAAAAEISERCRPRPRHRLHVKKVWRKLVDMMVDLQRDMQRKS